MLLEVLGYLPTLASSALLSTFGFEECRLTASLNVRLSVDASLVEVGAKVGGDMVRPLSARKISLALEKGTLERSRMT